MVMKMVAIRVMVMIVVVFMVKNEIMEAVKVIMISDYDDDYINHINDYD